MIMMKISSTFKQIKASAMMMTTYFYISSSSSSMMMHFMGLVSSSAQPYPLAEGQSVININACSHVLTALIGVERGGVELIFIQYLHYLQTYLIYLQTFNCVNVNKIQFCAQWRKV